VSTDLQVRVLFVDDEPFVLSALNRLFRGQYHLFFASSGAEALETLRRERIHVVVSDQRMPGMTGVELLRAIREASPATMRILLTGYSDLPAIIEAVNSGEVFRFITKPWNNELLKNTVAQAAATALRTATMAIAASKSQVVGSATGIPAPLTLTTNAATPTASVPAPIAQTASPPAPAAAPAPIGPKVDVLVLDTDPQFHAQVREIMAGERQVLGARSVEEALGVLEANFDVGVLVSDVRVGKDDLTRLLAILKAARPTLSAVIASGFADAELIIRLINQGQIYRFIRKPAPSDKLRVDILAAVRKHLQLKVAPALAERHRVELPKHVADAVTAHQQGGLRNLFTRVANLFR
jgi:DNA-binding NtrC family response regulator